MKEVVIGNFAISRGLLESGLDLITAYPGTPSSEILPGVVYFSEKEGWSVYAEWSVNERVALDVAFGGALEGLRTACAMKQVGFNVALPSFLGLKSRELKGGLVLCVADDPGPVSSQTEQDTRMLMYFLRIPVFDPSSPREAKYFSKIALKLSFMTGIPVCIRPVAKVSHAREPITLESRDSSTLDRVKIGSEKELLDVVRDLGRVNIVEEGEGGTFFVASGMSYSVLKDVLLELGINAPVVKIGLIYPFPKEEIEHFLSQAEKIVVFEETDVVIERVIRSLFPEKKVEGRLSGLVPSEGELSYEVIKNAVEEILGIHKGKIYWEVQKEIEKLNIPPRPPRLCPGCGHRGAFYAARRAFREAIYPGDIGCYTLGTHLGAVDTCLDMGASVSMATGFSEALIKSGKDTPVVATIGDSTFFHSGIQPLISGKERGYPFVLLILDNLTVAMTGNQPTPETGYGPWGDRRKSISIEAILEAIGFKALVMDPYDVPRVEEKIKELWSSGEPSVLILRRPCILRSKERSSPRSYIVEDCNGCKYCIENFDCPSLYFDEVEGKVKVDPGICVGCNVCLYVCPISRKRILND